MKLAVGLVFRRNFSAVTVCLACIRHFNNDAIVGDLSEAVWLELEHPWLRQNSVARLSHQSVL